jgi:hypothetical protein
MPKVSKEYRPKVALITSALASTYSAYVFQPSDNEATFMLTETAWDIMESGEGVEANLAALIEDVRSLSSFFYQYLDVPWLDGITVTEGRLFDTCWAVQALIFCLKEGDFCWTKEINIAPAVEAGKLMLDLANIVWAIEDYALPFETSARDLRDDYAEACKKMAQVEA